MCCRRARGSRCSSPVRSRTSTWCSRCWPPASSRCPSTRRSPTPSGSGSSPRSPPTWSSPSRTRSSSCSRPFPPPLRAAAAGASHPLHERHHRHPEGRLVRVALPRRRCGPRRRGTRPVGVLRRRRQPRAQPAAPLRAAALRDGHRAGRWPDRGAGPLRPGGRHRTLIGSERPTTMFCVPTHLQRLFAHWDEVGLPDLSSFRLVAHAGAPCPPALKRRLIEAFPDGVHVGVLRLDRGPVHRLPLRGVAGPPGHRRSRPARSVDHESTRMADSGAWCPRTPASPTSALPTRPPRPGARHRRAGLLGRRHRPDRRGRLRPPRRPSRRPRHQRRRQRLPAGGRERAARPRRRR